MFTSASSPEEGDLSAHQVRDTRLSHAQLPGGFGLRQVAARDVLLEGRHQDRPKLHVFSFFRGVLDRIPDTVESSLGHGRCSFISSR
jgi:hypothetical protein